MIQLIGHNAIIGGIAQKLIEQEIPFKVFSIKTPEDLETHTTIVENTEALKNVLLASKTTTLRLSAGAPWLFKASWLAHFEPTGIFNIHGTALPQDRGGTVASWLILNQKRLGHAVIHKIVPTPDAGPVLFSEEFIYPMQCQLPKDYIEVYNQNQIRAGVNCCLEWLAGTLDLTKVSVQPAYLSTYWPRLHTQTNGWIDWNWPGEAIATFIRAFDDPYDGAMTDWRGVHLHLKKAFFQPDLQTHPFQWGTVFRVRQTDNARYTAVAVQGGSLYIEEIIDEGGNDKLAVIRAGDRFYTTPDQLAIAQRRTMRGKGGLYPQKNHQT